MSMRRARMWLGRIAAAFLALAVSAGGSVSAQDNPASPAGGDGWPQWRGGPHRSGAVVWETTDPEWNPGGGQWSFTSVTVGSGVVCVLSGNQVSLFAAENGKRLAGSLAVDNLKGGTSFAVAGDSLVTRGTKAVVCYKAQRSSQESKP